MLLFVLGVMIGALVAWVILAQRTTADQSKIDALTSQLAAQNDRLRDAVATSTPDAKDS